MSERDFAICLATLAEAFGEKGLTPVRIDAYHRGLKDVPLPLLEKAVAKLIREYGTEPYKPKFPLVATIREAAEACRKDLLALFPYEACERCNHVGTVKVQSIDLASGHRVPKYERCSCYVAWQQQIEGMGASLQPLALPPAREDPDAA